MRGCAVLWLALWLAAPADSDTPGDFLKVESRAWNGWLNQEANVSWAGVALEDVLAGEFGPADLEIDPPGAMATAVTFDASDLSRREALWRLSQRYAFRVKWVRTDEPRVYLGLPETEERRQSVGGVVLVTMTQVMRTDYGNYESLKRRGKVRDEERVGNTIYFAVDDWRDLPFANGTSAMVPFVERYKTSSASVPDAENAKAALLRLIRGNRKVFVGDPDPDRLENVAIAAYDSQEPPKFSRGGFDCRSAAPPIGFSPRGHAGIRRANGKDPSGRPFCWKRRASRLRVAGDWAVSVVATRGSFHDVRHSRQCGDCMALSEGNGRSVTTRDDVSDG